MGPIVVGPLAWQASVPFGIDKLVDTFGMTGYLALLAWQAIGSFWHDKVVGPFDMTR